MERIKVRPKRKGNPLFVKGMKALPGAGRKPGVQNKTTVLLKTAILEAMALAGSYVEKELDDYECNVIKGPGEVVYLTWLAIKRPEIYGRLAEKLLPYQLTGKDGGPIETREKPYETKEEVLAELERRGLPNPQKLLADMSAKQPA